MGISGFYSRAVNEGGVAYLGSLRLRSAQALVDRFQGHTVFMSVLVCCSMTPTMPHGRRSEASLDGGSFASHLTKAGLL